jgi:hypothetical protein
MPEIDARDWLGGVAEKKRIPPKDRGQPVTHFFCGGREGGIPRTIDGRRIFCCLPGVAGYIAAASALRGLHRWHH